MTAAIMRGGRDTVVDVFGVFGQRSWYYNSGRLSIFVSAQSSSVISQRSLLSLSLSRSRTITANRSFESHQSNRFYKTISIGRDHESTI